MDTGTIIAIAGIFLSASVNVALVARWSGKTTAQMEAMRGDIKRLEEKQDKSNAIKERLIVCEERSKSNTHRLDEIDATPRRTKINASK